MGKENNKIEILLCYNSIICFYNAFMVTFLLHSSEINSNKISKMN